MVEARPPGVTLTEMWMVSGCTRSLEGREALQQREHGEALVHERRVLLRALHRGQVQQLLPLLAFARVRYEFLEHALFRDAAQVDVAREGAAHGARRGEQ